MLPALVSAFTVSAVLSWYLARVRGHWQVLDIPNERSLHSDPVPRTGGLAILSGTSAGLLVAWYGQGNLLIGLPLGLTVIVLAVVALVDDRHDLGAGVRLLTQLAAVSYLLFNAPMLDFTPTAAIISLLFLVWMINLYNFMDGMDGFAGGMAIIGFGTYAVLAWQAGNPALTLTCGMLVAACGGFLLQNFPPARIFMGDVGSTVLGLLAGVTILLSHRNGLLPVWLGILVFSPFIIDASVTITVRILRGEQFWKPHKSHCYQRVVQAGWGHRRTVLTEYALMLACSGSALIGATLPLTGQIFIIALWTLLYAVLIGFVYSRTE